MAEHEPMVEVFIYETRQFLEQLEQMALTSEQEGSFPVLPAFQGFLRRFLSGYIQIP